MNRKIGVILSYVLMVFEILFTLLLTPFILRTLGQAEYGVYRLSGTIIAYLLLLDLGVSNASIRFLSKYRANNDPEQGRRFMGVSIIYYAAIAFVALIAGIALIWMFPSMFAEGLSPPEILLGQKLLGVTVITACITLVTSPFYSSLIAYEKFAVSRGASIIQIILRMALTYLGLVLGFGSIGIVVINLILTLFTRTFFIAYSFVKLKIKPIFNGLKFDFIKEIVAYSSFILLQMVATQINAGLGQIMLGAFVSSSAVIIGIYSVGTQIVQYFQSIGSSMTGVLMPGIVKLVENGASPRKLCDEMVRIGRIIFMVLALVWVGFLTCGQQFVTLWAGKVNSEAFFVAFVLITVYLVILTQVVGSQILWAKNQHKEISILKIVIVIINIGVTFTLMKSNALIGATLGTAISLLLGDIILTNIIFKKKLKISLRQYYFGLIKGIVPCMIISSVCGILFGFLKLSGWLGFIWHGMVVFLTFSIPMYLFGMNKYEKNLIKGIICKLFRRKKHESV